MCGGKCLWKKPSNTGFHLPIHSSIIHLFIIHPFTVCTPIHHPSSIIHNPFIRPSSSISFCHPSICSPILHPSICLSVHLHRLVCYPSTIHLSCIIRHPSIIYSLIIQPSSIRLFFIHPSVHHL